MKPPPPTQPFTLFTCTIHTIPHPALTNLLHCIEWSCSLEILFQHPPIIQHTRNAERSHWVKTQRPPSRGHQRIGRIKKLAAELFTLPIRATWANILQRAATRKSAGNGIDGAERGRWWIDFWLATFLWIMYPTWGRGWGLGSSYGCRGSTPTPHSPPESPHSLGQPCRGLLRKADPGAVCSPECRYRRQSALCSVSTWAWLEPPDFITPTDSIKVPGPAGRLPIVVVRGVCVPDRAWMTGKLSHDPPAIRRPWSLDLTCLYLCAPWP